MVVLVLVVALVVIERGKERNNIYIRRHIYIQIYIYIERKKEIERGLERIKIERKGERR